MIEALPSMLTRLTRRAPDADMAAGAALARCRRLLMGIDRVVHSGDEEDLAGIFVRPLFETWLTAFYLLFEGDEGWEELKEGARRAMEVMNRLATLDVAAVAAWEGAKKAPSAALLAERVRRHFDVRGEESADFVTYSYNLVYRHASLLHVHGGAAPLMGHLEPGPTWQVRPIRADEHPSSVHLLCGGMLVGILADHLLEHFELPVLRGQLDEITKPLEEARDPATWSFSVSDSSNE